MQRLYTAANLPEAHLLLHELEAAGIRARVFNQNAQGGVGELPFTETYPVIWIENDADAARAHAIVAEFERPMDGGGTVICRSCGEENPHNFDLCWHCGAALR